MENGIESTNFFLVEMTILLPHVGRSKLYVLKHVAKKTFAAYTEQQALELARQDVMELAPKFKASGFNTDFMDLNFKVINGPDNELSQAL